MCMNYLPRTHSTVIVDINIKGITRSVIRKLLTAKFKTNLNKNITRTFKVVKSLEFCVPVVENLIPDSMVEHAITTKHG